jgi:MarR family 2-MHQ and catechol resistance regulon transcriptional repressor
MATVDEHLVLALSSVMRSLDRPLARHIASEALTPTQFAVLEMLLHKGPCTVNEIIEGLLSSSGNVGVVIDNLLAAGLLEKRPNPADGRSRLVSLTAAGGRKIRAYYPRHRDELSRLMAGVDRTEKKRLIKALAVLRRCLDENAAQMPRLSGSMQR